MTLEKFLNVVKLIAILLIVVLISVISFFGIYVKKDVVWENILPEYKTGMEFDGYMQLRYALDDTEESKEIFVDSEGNYKGDVLVSLNGETTENNEETQNVAEEAELDVVNGYSKKNIVQKVNPDEKINIETFEKTKKIIQERIENQGEYEYNIRQDSITGELVLEVPDNDNVEVIDALVTSVGEISIIDSEKGFILIDNSYIKQAGVLTNPLSPEEIGNHDEHNHEHSDDEVYYQAYLQLQFNEEGAELIKEVSKEYLVAENEADSKMITVKFDDESLITTYFGEELATGDIQIPLGNPMLPGEEFNDIVNRVVRVADVINTEELPLVYKLVANNYVESAVTEDVELIMNIVFAVIIVVVSIIMIIRYKFNGFKQAIISVGFIASLLLMIRFVSVIFTYNSLISFMAIVLINYVFGFKCLEKLKNETNRKIALKETMKELYLAIIPVCIIACIFTFMSSVVISSMGNVLFWGLLVQALFSLLVLI